MMTLTVSAPNRSIARAAALLLVLCAPVMVTSVHLSNVCWSPTQGICGPTTCRVGNSYSCGDTGECTCFDMNTGCGSNTSLPSGLLGKEYCGFRAEPSGDECGWCAATSECSTRAACPATPPTPAPAAPTPQPTPAPPQWTCADLRPACNTCGACCNSHFDAASCKNCVADVCKPEPPPVPCELSPFNITPAPRVLRGPCKCTVSKVRFPADRPLVYTFSALGYADGAGCDMRLPAGAVPYAEPIFATEYQRDVLQLNGRNFSGINRVIGGIPTKYNYSVTDTNMYWRPDDRIVGTGWELTFAIADPLPPPDPGSTPRVYSGACFFVYNPGQGTGWLSSPDYNEGIVTGRCTIIVPQGWYVSSASFESRSSGNTLAIGEHVYSGSTGPAVGMQLSGLVRWDATHFVDKHDCVDVAPYRCGFQIFISKEKPTVHSPEHA